MNRLFNKTDTEGKERQFAGIGKPQLARKGFQQGPVTADQRYKKKSGGLSLKKLKPEWFRSAHGKHTPKETLD